ncbi:serine hydrolase domain-containing protein [Pedobacter antarcticus]|uniref:serine hydrolase domain-containing protein n=1 Tax=Pedobacter antarcticus TaxID=34086 RepID=UPI00087E1650|nr:serine hydrolase domain-containing protein [Pedobacter antarcticus]SDM27328.1 Beta-lactamase [Pedobacter antarcticus]
MNRISICTLASIILFSIAAQKLAAQSKPVEKELQELMLKFQAIGLNVAVVKSGKIIYQHAFGLKSREAGTSLAMNNLFRIASISKSFSATAIMQLVESGKVSLDADFGELIGFRLRNPKFPQTPITLRMVLSHTSSINDSQGYFNFDIINPEKNPDWEKCYDAYEPGKGYAYCNLNFNMAGAVIEKLSGERFDRYIQNHILRPLQIKGGYNIDSLDKNLFTTLYEFDSVSRKFLAAPPHIARVQKRSAPTFRGITHQYFLQPEE